MSNSSRSPRFARAAALALSATVLSAPLVATPVASAAPASCGHWAATTLARGYGALENLAFDGRGGLLLSEQSATGGPGTIVRQTADGRRTALVRGVDGPGGIVVTGRTAYFTTGNSFAKAFTGAADGTVSSVDLGSGAVRRVAGGLTMPNGLERLPTGEFVVSRDLGGSTTMTVVSADGARKRPYATALTSTNGLAYDARRGRLYVTSTFTPTTTVSGVDIRHPGRRPTRAVVPGVGPINAADDLTVGADGKLYVALNAVGRVVRVDPDSGRSCVIAENLPFTSSVRFGAGRGWNPRSLYATSFLGTVTELSPRTRR